MASSCRVEAGDRQMTVNLGQISGNRFHDVGKALARSLSRFIYRIAVPQSASMWGWHFTAWLLCKNPDVLSVGEGPGIASGIGIALFDSQGQQLPLNRPPDRWVPLYRGPTTLNLSPNIGRLDARSPAARPTHRPGSH